MFTIRLPIRSGPVLVLIVIATAAIYGGSLVLQLIGAIYDHDHIFGLLPLLHVDREGNLAAWISSFVMLLSAIVAWSIAESGRDADRTSRTGWRLVALALLLMSIDEAAQLHEWIGSLVQPALPNWGFLYFGWVAVGLIVIAAATPFFIRFVRTLPTVTRLHLVAGAGIFLFGAVGVEMVTAMYMASAENKLSLTYITLSHIEEFCEMIGLIVVLKGLMGFAVRGGATAATGAASASIPVGAPAA